MKARLLLAVLAAIVCSHSLAAEPEPEPAKMVPWRLDIRVYSGKSDRLSKNEQYDDRAVKLGFKIEVKNLDFKKKLENAKATLVAFGKSVTDNGEFKVMLHQSFPLTIDVNQTQTEQSQEVTFEYDERDSAQFGYKYFGYVLVVHNEKGEMISIKGTPPMFVTNAHKVLPMKQGSFLDRDFRPSKGAR